MESKQQKPLDVRTVDATRIAIAICSEVNGQKRSGESFNSFYAGICKDVEENMQRHCNNSYISLCDCGSRQKAGDVETLLGEYGFDVGDKPNNGGDEETTIVYVIRKDSNFRR